MKSGDIDLVVSDHSPCTPDLKYLAGGDNADADFLKAWGGISSLQFGKCRLKQNDSEIYYILKALR